jgi:hypothetical protein
MRLILLGAVVAIGCGSSLRETCDDAARPGTWRITTTLDHTDGSPGPCPTIQLTIAVPQSTVDVQSDVRYMPRTSELGSVEECWASYRQGSPSDGGRTACSAPIAAGSPTRASQGECLFQVGPPDAYGDFSAFCYYTAVWERVE